MKSSQSSRIPRFRSSQRRSQSQSTPNPQDPSGQPSEPTINFLDISFIQDAIDKPLPPPNPHSKPELVQTRDDPFSSPKSSKSFKHVTDKIPERDIPNVSVTSRSTLVRANTDGPMVSNMNKIPEDGRRNPIFDSRMEYTVDYSMHETELDIPKEQMAVETLLVKADEAQIPERDNSSSLSSARDNDYCNLDALLSSASSSGTSLDDVLIANALNPYMEERSWLQFLKFDDEDTNGNLSLDKVEISQSIRKSGYQRTENYDRPGRAREVLRESEILNSTGMVDQRKQELHNSNQRRRATSTEQAASFQPSSIRKSDIRKPPASAPLSIMSIQKLRHLGRSHSAKISIPKIDITVDSFFAHQQLLSSSPSLALKPSITIEIEYSFPMTPVERDIIDASGIQTERVKLIASCPNPYPRTRYDSAQNIRKSSNLASLPVTLNHQTIFPCKFDASMIDHWMNQPLTVKYTAFIHVPQKRSSAARRKADHATTMEKDILIEKIWTGISTFDLSDVLKSDAFIYCHKIPIWKTSINATNKENVDDSHWQNHWLGDVDIQVEILPSFELPAEQTASLNSLTQPLKLLPPSPIPLYFYIQISRFTSCIPTMPTPSYHVTARSQNSQNVPSSNMKIRDVYLSLSARLFPTPGNPILSDEPSKLAQSTFQQSLKSLIPIETKPLIWYREITRTKQGTAVEEVEVERVRPDNPAETGPLDQIDFGFNYMLPLSIDASVLETWAKFPLVVELWKLEFDSSLNDMNASTAGLPHPGGSKPKRSLLGILRIPVHHLLSTLMLSYSRSHDLSTIASSKERNPDLSLFWSTLPMRIPHTEYPVVDILAGETRGWCDVGIAIGQYEHIEDIKRAWTKHGNELKEPQTMRDSSLSFKKEIVTREVGDDIDDGYVQEPKSLSKRRQSRSQPKAPVKQRRSKSTKTSRYDIPASASIQATIHRTSDLRRLAVHAFADYLDSFRSTVSDSLDDFEAMNNHLTYALQAGLNSYVTLQILPIRYAKQYISNYQTDIISPIAAQEFRPQFQYESSLRLSKIDEKLIRWFREGGSDDLKSNSLLADVFGIENRQNPFGCVKGGQCVGFIYHRVPRDIFQSLDSSVNDTERTSRHSDILIGVFQFGLARLLEYPAGLKQFWLPVRLPRDVTQMDSLAEQPISSIQLSAKFAVDGGNTLQDNDSDPFESVKDQKQLVAQLNISVEKLAFKSTTGNAPSSTVYFKWNKTDIIDELDLFFSESEPTFVATSEPLDLPISNADSNEVPINFQSSVNVDLQPESLEKVISSVIQLQLWKTNDSSNDEQLLATSFIDMFQVGMKIKKLCQKMAKCMSEDNDIAKHFNLEGDVPCVPALDVNLNDGFSPSSVHVKISVDLRLQDIVSQKEKVIRTHEIDDLHGASEPRDESHQVPNLSSHNRNDEGRELKPAGDVTRMEITIEKALNLPNVLTSSSPPPALAASLSQVPPNAFVTFSWQDDKGTTGPDQTLNESRFSVSSVFRSSIISTTNSSHKQIYSTDVISGSSNPEWNYTVSVPQCISLFALERLRVRKIVVMKVWHRDFHTPTSNGFSTSPSFTDKLIGFSRIDLSPLVSGLRELHGYYQIIDFRGDNIGQLVVGIKPAEDLMRTLISKRKGDLKSTGNHEQERRLKNIYTPGLPDLEELKQKVRHFETLASKQLQPVESPPPIQENPNSVEILPLNDAYPRMESLYIPNIDSSVTEKPLTPLLPSICNLPPQPQEDQVESHNFLRQSLSKSLASLDHLQRELKSRLGVSPGKQPGSFISEAASTALSEVSVSNNISGAALQSNPLIADIFQPNTVDDDVRASDVGESEDEIPMDPNTFRYATGEARKDNAGSEGTFPEFFVADVLWSEVEMMAKEILESNEDEMENPRQKENVDDTITPSEQLMEGTCITVEQITSTEPADHTGSAKSSQNDSHTVDTSQVNSSPPPKHENPSPKDQHEESDDDWDIPMRNLNIKASTSVQASASGKSSVSSPKKASTSFLSTSQLRDQAKAMEEKLQSALAEFNFPSRTLSYSSTLSRSQNRPQPLPLPPLAFYSSSDHKPPLGPGVTNILIKTSDGKRYENHRQSSSVINELSWSKLSKDESERIRKIFHDDKRNEEVGSELVE